MKGELVMWVQSAIRPHRAINLGNYTSIDPPVLLMDGYYLLRCWSGPQVPNNFDDWTINAADVRRIMSNPDPQDIGAAIKEWEAIRA